jgi:hypothetical protein
MSISAVKKADGWYLAFDNGHGQQALCSVRKLVPANSGIIQKAIYGACELDASNAKESPEPASNAASDEICSHDICEYCIHYDACMQDCSDDFSDFEGRKLRT